LLHQLPAVRTPFGDAYAELYLAQPADSSRVALTRSGTRVIDDLATLPGLEHAPWSSRYLQGLYAGPLFSVVISPASSTTPVNARGLPGYTFERAAGELWRSRFDAARNLIIVNNGHRDFVFATKNRALQLRYLVRLYVKELVLKNFTGVPPEQLLERMIELSLYAEEKLKAGGS